MRALFKCHSRLSQRSEQAMTRELAFDYKNYARRLREALAADGIAVSHTKTLELVARQNGAPDWNTLAARPSARNGCAVCFIGDLV
jgi:hypothetical protein